MSNQELMQMYLNGGTAVAASAPRASEIAKTTPQDVPHGTEGTEKDALVEAATAATADLTQTASPDASQSAPPDSDAELDAATESLLGILKNAVSFSDDYAFGNFTCARRADGDYAVSLVPEYVVEEDDAKEMANYLKSALNKDFTRVKDIEVTGDDAKLNFTITFTVDGKATPVASAAKTDSDAATAKADAVPPERVFWMEDINRAHALFLHSQAEVSTLNRYVDGSIFSPEYLASHAEAVEKFTALAKAEIARRKFGWSEQPTRVRGVYEIAENEGKTEILNVCHSDEMSKEERYARGKDVLRDRLIDAILLDLSEVRVYGDITESEADKAWKRYEGVSYSFHDCRGPDEDCGECVASEDKPVTFSNAVTGDVEHDKADAADRKALDLLSKAGVTMAVRSRGDGVPEHWGLGGKKVEPRPEFRIVFKSRNGGYGLNFYGTKGMEKLTALTVLATLQTVAPPETVEEFAAQYGLEDNLVVPEERKGIVRMHNAVKREYNAVKRIFGAEHLAELAEFARYRG